MKIKNDQQKMQDLTNTFLELQDKHSTVYMYQIEDDVFMYRPLGRSEFKKLVSDTRFNEMQKEEIICQVCVLWPEGFDFEDCEAGIPTTLSDVILKNSYLDSIETRKNVLNNYRQEMYDLDNQITCIINEAFPQFDIEEIEDWDIAKTAKYLSRAEWKLVNLRGAEMRYDPMESAPAENKDIPVPKNVKTEEIVDPPKNLKGTEKKKLTPDEFAKLKSKYPEMEWGNNVMDDLTIESFKDNIDSTSPALRPGY